MRIVFLTVSAMILLAGACGTQERVGSTEADTSKVLATVGDVQITRNMLDEEMEMIPPYQRTTFESPSGRRLLLDHLIERELLIQEAKNLGLDEDSFVVAQVDLAMQQVDATRERAMIQTFYQNEVVDRVEVPEADIQAYYDEHIDDMYHQEAQVRVSHIMVPSPEDTSAVAEALAAGDDFTAVVQEYSQHEPTRNADGDMGWVTANSPMPYLGEQAEITESLFQAVSDEIVGPFPTTMGYHYFMVSEIKEEGSRPLEDVRESIENTIRPTLVNTYFEETVIPGLHEEYQVTIENDAFLPDEGVSADSLFQSAQNMMESNPEASVEYYRLFIERFPDNERAHQAQFLIGFTLSEYMRDFERAEEAFQKLITDYPESDFADDAAWMIENMGTPPESLFIDENVQMETDTSGE